MYDNEIRSEKDRIFQTERDCMEKCYAAFDCFFRDDEEWIGWWCNDPELDGDGFSDCKSKCFNQQMDEEQKMLKEIEKKYWEKYWFVK